MNTVSAYPRGTSGDRVQLGKFSVTRIGFGAMQLPGPGAFGPPKDHDQAIAVLQHAVEMGVNHIDSAQYYGPNAANELVTVDHLRFALERTEIACVQDPFNLIEPVCATGARRMRLPRNGFGIGQNGILDARQLDASQPAGSQNLRGA
jgi:hypothetical protein